MLVSLHPGKHTTHYRTNRFCLHPNIHVYTYILKETNRGAIHSVVILCSSMKLGKYFPVPYHVPRHESWFWDHPVTLIGMENHKIWKKPAIREKLIHVTRLWTFGSWVIPQSFGEKSWCMWSIIPFDIPISWLILHVLDWYLVLPENMVPPQLQQIRIPCPHFGTNLDHLCCLYWY